ncbi:MAG: SH3 domain-containing protein [Oscillospiraceae bacterium]|nr:SH3 domain-containing protein [Oscillospiraceae bacterium]
MYCPECSNKIDGDELNCPYCGCEFDEPEVQPERPRIKVKTIVIICVAVVLVAALVFLVLSILDFAENPRPPQPTPETSQDDPVAPDGPPEYPVGPGAGAQAEQAARVNAGGGLRMREGPGVDYDIVVLIPNYEHITILEEEGGWALVEYSNASGWVSAEFLIREGDPRFLEEPVEHEVTSGTRSMNPSSARINAEGGLRMRMGPGTSYHVVMVIPDEQAVFAHDESDGWVYVEHLGHWGWVSADFLIDE